MIIMLSVSKLLDGSSPLWKVIQYQFTAWPDHGVPEYAGPILTFIKHIKVKQNQDKHPLLVHCRYDDYKPQLL